MSFAAALLAALALASCKPPRPSGLSQKQVLEGFSIDESRRGKPAWSLQARLAFLNEGSRKVSLSEPRLSFYKNGRLFSQARSNEGTADLSSRDVLLSSSVVVESLEDRTVLKTESLAYSAALKKFTTDQPVLLKRPGAVMRGRGLEANADLSELRIFKQEAEVERQP